MKGLIKLSVFASIYTMVTIGDSVGTLILNLILAGFLWLVANYCYKLVQQINQVHEYMITHTERHKSIEGEIKRIEDDLNKKVDRIENKLDHFIEHYQKDES